ncbi:LysR family transcriptional regulator [Kineosporia rhizophila]|uniref:LysR family transcriptional regulator n=1 Tax=Kineosporia TaxID=49184 RepID=UPI001E48930E|nr:MULTISPECIES: LysR family transcriptional regulator [Kineosporia]MCE0535583.1 LysR family transcriptional regulator [Kineosporia rhizophila]GLY17774.1 LysR family transcriptional regulator [Kineosporia sp. NBRC 101677]
MNGHSGIELRQLRCLVAVADNGTFTDAAIELGISQAAVSRSVAALEAALGVTLLHRTTRSVEVSPVGAGVIVRARRILADVAQLQQVVDPHLRLGYAWSALGRHTVELQRTWAQRYPGTRLTLIQSNTPTAGLDEGTADVAVIRRPLAGARFAHLATELVATEARFAAVATDDPWARRRFVRLRDFAGRTLAVDHRTGTTTPDLWPAGEGPARVVDSHSVDEWLTMIAAGHAVGMTAEATVAQYPRPGIVYRPVRDAERTPVRLAWRRDAPAPLAGELLALARELYDR